MIATQPPDDGTFARFSALYAELAAERHWWTDQDAWLAFAAQAAMATPGEPGAVAAAIRRAANALRRETARPEALHSAMRFLAAALLIHLGADPASFAAHLPGLRRHLQAVHLRDHGPFPLIALLLLWLRGGEPGQERIARLRDLYALHRAQHRWLAGPHDLPVCACLVDLPDEPAAIAGTAGSCYRELRRHGLPAGFPPEQASLLLPLTGLPAMAATDRFQRLLAAVATRRQVPLHQDFAAVALLALLDLEPGPAADAVSLVHHRLAGLHPPLQHEAVIGLAAALTVPTLAMGDARLAHLPAGEAAAGLRTILRTGLAASAVLACFAATSVDSTVC